MLMRWIWQEADYLSSALLWGYFLPVIWYPESRHPRIHLAGLVGGRLREAKLKTSYEEAMEPVQMVLWQKPCSSALWSLPLSSACSPVSCFSALLASIALSTPTTLAPLLPRLISILSTLPFISILGWGTPLYLIPCFLFCLWPILHPFAAVSLPCFLFLSTPVFLLCFCLLIDYSTYPHSLPYVPLSSCNSLLATLLDPGSCWLDSGSMLNFHLVT